MEMMVAGLIWRKNQTVPGGWPPPERICELTSIKSKPSSRWQYYLCVFGCALIENFTNPGILGKASNSRGQQSDKMLAEYLQNKVLSENGGKDEDGDGGYAYELRNKAKPTNPLM